MLVARCFWAFTYVCNSAFTCLYSCLCLLCFFFINSLHYWYLVKIFVETCAHWRNIVSLVTYIRLGGVYLANFMFDLHPFVIFGFVSNLYPSRRNFVIQPISRLTYTRLRDLVIFGFVSNLHPFTQNLIT